jgi:hypothetical protein
MRFVDTELGTERVKTWFALFPVSIGRETRWLEKVTVKQEYKKITSFDIDGDPQSDEDWYNVKFIDEE